jgi:hypothetical protein
MLMAAKTARRWKKCHPPKANFSFALQTMREIRTWIRFSA